VAARDAAPCCPTAAALQAKLEEAKIKLKNDLRTIVHRYVERHKLLGELVSDERQLLEAETAALAERKERLRVDWEQR
jgi:uncharacterized membrane-anchored protein YhcB (DUF1043 family)